MDQNEYILRNLGLAPEMWGRVYTFVDFGNVNRWFDRDRTPWQQIRELIGVIKNSAN